MKEGETTSSAPESIVATAKGTKSRDYLTLAGWGLIAYGIYNILIILFSGAGGPEVPLQRMSQLVSLFPVLFIGPALVHASQPSARQSKRIHHQLLRWLVMVICISYLAFVPISIYNLFSNERANDNAIARLESTLQKKRKELFSAMETAVTPQQIRSALTAFPEVSNVTIEPGDSLDEVRQGIRNGIDQWIRSQLEQARKANTSSKQYLQALVRTVALGCLICGLAMLAMAVRMLPWLQQLGESTLQTVSQTGESIATSLRQLRRKGSKTASSGPTVGLQLQKNSQQLGRLLKRMPNPLQQIERSQRQLQRSMHSLTKSSLRLFKQLTPSKGRRSSSRRSQRRR